MLLSLLHELIENDEKVTKRVKLIGIGAGNSAFEVGVFKKKYKVPFPLFADNHLAIHKVKIIIRIDITINYFNIILKG